MDDGEAYEEDDGDDDNDNDDAYNFNDEPDDATDIDYTFESQLNKKR